MKSNLPAATILLATLSAWPSIDAGSHGWMPIPVFTGNRYGVLEGSRAGVYSNSNETDARDDGSRGRSDDDGYDYYSDGYGYDSSDAWLDSEEGYPTTPRVSRVSYHSETQEGRRDNNYNIIQVDVAVDVAAPHNYGHFTVSACPTWRESTRECFDSNPLEFVRDLATGMPKDESHPERAMLWGDSGGASYLFQLPDGFRGDEVSLRWNYWTATDRNYDGYDQYFQTHLNHELAGISGCWWLHPGVQVCGGDDHSTTTTAKAKAASRRRRNSAHR